MKYKKIIVLTIFLVSLLAVSAVSATDNATCDVVSLEETTTDVIGSTTNEVVIIDDNSTVEADFDLLEDEGYKIDKNTISFNLNELNVPYSENDYYIFDYDDGENCKELSSSWLNTHVYSYNLNLTNNSNYTYVFYGHTTIVGHLHGRPWTYGQYSDSNLILQGSFKTDDYGNIIDFSHDQHLRLVLSNYNNSCTIVSISKPFAHSYNLNGEFVGLSIGKKLNVGMNIIEETYQNNNYIQNYAKKVFNIFVHDNSCVKTFRELAAKINSGKSEIVLDCDYKYNFSIDSNYQSGVEISKDKTIFIDGQGHLIDGNGQSKILNVWGNNVVLKNMIFTNIFSDSTQKNPAVSWFGDNGVLENCSFINISVKYGTSALTIGDNAKIINCSFINNNARTGSNTVELKGDTQVINCKFINNTCEQGGAIYSYLKNNTIINCEFINNTASMWGGAIHFSYYSNKNIILNCSFKGNSANHNGGSIDIRGDENYLLNNLFVENVASKGGAICWSGDDGKITNCSFINNSASSLQGGAIFWEGDEGIINEGYFENNSASHSNGGAIFNSGNMFALTNNSFVNNYAFYNGGAVLVSANEFILDNCTFINNSAKSGSVRVVNKCIVKNCLFNNNFALENGGAIEWEGNDGTLEHCFFINNHVSSNKEGGAIYWTGNNGILSNCSFINNSAYGGGAISLYGNGSKLIDCLFIDNSAFGAGGAIYLPASHCILFNCSFMDNNATQLAGAIFLVGTNNLLNKTIFINHHANDGGAIIIQETNNQLINCIFRDNNASRLAGAIYIIKNDCILENCTFVNNSANDGGSILIQGNNTSLNQNSFINNNAFGFGGAIYWISSDGTLTNSSFNNNYAKNGGGIFWQGDNGALTDCEFIDNYAPNNGSSIYWYGNYGNLTNSIIIDNIMSNQIYWWNTENGNIENCKFINNTNGVINKGAKFSRTNISLSYSNLSFDFKDPKNILVTLIDVSEGLPINSSILFNFNKDNIVEEFIANISDNFASLCNELSDLNAGTWNVTAIFIGDDNHAPSNVTFTVTINPLSSSLTINVNDTDVYGEASIVVTVCDKFSSMIDDGSVIFFDGETNIGKSNVVDGVATLTYVPETAGKHLIIAKYYAKNYINNTNSVDLNVEKIDSNIIISDMFFDYGTRGFVNFNLDGAIGINASIVNNSNIIVDIIDDYIFVSGLDAGNYVLEVAAIPDANHISIIKHINITVNPINANLTVNIPKIEIGSNAIVNIEINKEIAGKVLFDNNEIIIIDGKGNYTITNPSVGDHTVSVIFEGDNNFNADTKIVSFEVTKRSVPNDQNPFTPAKTDDEKLPNNPSYTITLNEDATGNLTVTIGDKTFTKELINGTVTVEVNGVPAGDYIATITYSGDDNYAPITRTVNATVKVDPVITASNVNVVYSVGSYYTIKVYGTDGKHVNGATVKIAGKISKTLTTTNGVAKFKVTNVPGTYKITITALGKSVTRTITVKHLVTLKTVTVKKSAKQHVLQATLGKVNGKYLNKKTVTFKFNGKTYKAKTNSKGVAKVTIKSSVLKKLKVGKKVTYQATYLKDTVKKTVTVKK